MTEMDPGDRFAVVAGAKTMMAVVTTGNGGYEQLVYREVNVPQLSTGEVLVKVLAAGVNNTEINTRLGWYSSSITTSTEEAAAATQGAKADGGWNGATPFPIIQGTDCCGQVVAVAKGGDEGAIGSRVLVRSSTRPLGYSSMDNLWLGSNFDGAFAQFVKVRADDVFAVRSRWSDAELATIPCAYGTAENLLHRANVMAGERVVITGASGGVGSAAVQLAKRRGAHVVAIAGAAKADQVRAAGADVVIDRNADVCAQLGENYADAVIDVVAGPAFGSMLRVLARGGRYATAGAIGGPLVTLDVRDIYLKDLTLIGGTTWDEAVFANLIGYIERDEIRPLLAKEFPLDQIAEAQRAFLEKKHVGNFVLIPPAVTGVA